MPKSRFLAILMTTAFAWPALALDDDDVLGRWAVDTEALRTQMERMLEGRFDELPEDQRDAAVAMAKGQIDAMTAQMAGEAEFRPDGTAVFTSARDPESYGTWSLENDRLHFARETRMPNEPAYVGTVEDDVIRVHPEGEPVDGSFTLTLRRID